MNGFGICFMLDVLCCPVILANGAHEWVWFLLYLRCLCVVLLSQPKLEMNGFGICYISDVCMLSCYLRPRME